MLHVIPFQYVRNIDENQQKGVPTSNTFIESLENIEVTTEDDLECAICLKTMSKGDILHKLPCLHKFHKECIIKWLKKINSCPLCRKELPKDSTVS